MVKTFIAALSLLSLPAGVFAAASSKQFRNIAFSSAAVEAGVSMSSGLASSADGLKDDGKALDQKELWLEFMPISAEAGESRPQEIALTMQLKGAYADADAFPRRAYVRYGPDGRSWTSWQDLPGLETAASAAVAAKERRFWSELSISSAQRAQTPYIGYVQIRVEGRRARSQPNTIKNAVVMVRWSVD